MDKIFSTRMDEGLIRQVNRFVKKRSITKKGMIEQALKTYLDQVGSNIESDIVDRSFGAWARNETPSTTWSHGRQVFNKGFSRHIKNQ
jgi:hypothetical protein